MMNWSVTYRAKDGKQVEDIFEAESREALFKILSDKGITAIRVCDAKRGCRPVVSGNRRNQRKLARIAGWALAGVAVVVGAFLAVRSLHTTPKEQPKTTARDRTALPAVTLEKPTERRDPAPEPPKRTVTPEERKAGLDAVRNREYEGPVLDMDTYVSPDPGFSNRWERFKAEQAKLPFKYMSENEIAVVLDTKPGDMVLDIISHPNFERDFLKSLEEAIIPLPTDDEKTAQLKRDMVQAKIVLKEAYDNGESITDILREERAQLIKIHGLRENLFRELKEIEKTATSSQEIDDFVSAANLMLDEYGAKHIKLPYSKERMRLERAEGLLQ